MCRIVGFWDQKFSGGYDLGATLDSMRDSLAHGGPDDAGSYLEENIRFGIANRRLSILDLSSAGHQPMEDEDFVVTYNGEIYNYEEIRTKLIQLGYKFSSHSDTEVILKAWKKWGKDALKLFRGMWAFAIWDKKKKILTLCRDRIGVKPLFWYFKDGLFLFASELKAFHKHPGFRKELDETALALYLQYGYIPAPYSIFKNTFKLKPGHFLTLDSSGKIETFPYWDVSEFFRLGSEEREYWLKRNEDDVAEELEGILREAFRLRMVSDVPVGMFLSGGIDSSLLAALLQREIHRPLKTFTIGFYEKAYNEAHWAERVAQYLGTEHTVFYCTPREALDVIPKIPDLYDEPNGDSSIIPTYLVSKLARDHVKVSLSADGGDEQFCGYRKYWLIKNIFMLKEFPALGKIVAASLKILHPQIAFILGKQLNRILPGWQNFYDRYSKLSRILQAKTEFEMHDIIVSAFTERELAALGLSSVSGYSFWEEAIISSNLDFITKVMWRDLKTHMVDDILVKVDRATMSVGLEGREPFLDHKVIEYSSRLPLEFKYRNGQSKVILRKILYKYLPAELINRPKMGFSIPLYDWFRNELKDLYLEYLDKERIGQEGIFNPDFVTQLLNRYFTNKGISQEKLWYLFIFQLWKEKWL